MAAKSRNRVCRILSFFCLFFFFFFFFFLFSFFFFCAHLMWSSEGFRQPFWAPLLSSSSTPPPTQPSITLRLGACAAPVCLPEKCAVAVPGDFRGLPGPIRGSSKVSVPDKVNIVIRADPLARRPTPADWRLAQLIIALLFNTTWGDRKSTRLNSSHL